MPFLAPVPQISPVKKYFPLDPNQPMEKLKFFFFPA